MKLLREFTFAGTRRLLAFQALVDTVGTGLSVGILAIYLVGPADFSNFQAGALLATVGVTGFLATFAAAPLAQRIGARQYVLGGAVIRGISMAAIAVTPTAVTIVIALFVVSLAESGSYSVYRVIVAAAAGDEERGEAIAARRAIGAVGFMVSALLVGVVLTNGTAGAFSAAFALDAATFAVSALLVARLPRSIDDPEVADHATADAQSRRRAWRDRRYVALAFLAAVSSLSVPLFEVGLPLWVTHHTRAPAWIYATAILLNTAFTALLQIRLAKSAEGVGGALRALGFGAALIGGGAAVLAMAGTGTGADAGVAAGLIVGAATLLTLGEMLHSAAWWTIAFEAAPRDRRTEYVVLFDLGLPLAIGLGPVLFVGVLAAGSVGWLVYAGIVVGAAAAARMLMTAAPQPEPAAA